MKRMMPHCLFSLAISISNLSYAVAFEPPADLSRFVGESEPIKSLPNHVQAPEGHLSLFADFDHPLPKGIPLYVINKTQKTIVFDCQDNDIYLKLHSQTSDGSFARAQPHGYSDCGNSYYYSVLETNQYFKIRGYQPATGKKSTIRYQLCHEEIHTLPDPPQTSLVDFNPGLPLISNSGPGLASPKDIQAARTDDMALRYDGDFNLIRDMALGRITPESVRIRWTRESAIYYLARFNTDESANTLISLLKQKELTEPVIQALAKLGPKNAKAESRFQKLLYGQNIEHRLLAINALHYRRDSNETLMFGKSLLSESNPELRLAALKLLKGYTAANPELKQLIRKYEDDSDVDIRIFVAECDHSWSGEEEWQRKSRESSQGASVSNPE